MTIAADERECTEQLARFFPKLPAVRIAVQVTSRRNGQLRMKESTVVEFATAEYAIFLSKLALEFDDRVRLVRAGAQSVEAAVIALQYHEGRKAVAVRFLDGPCKWMMQP
jgi:4-aminobutyrate aminotransferase-like enzyme